MITSSILRTVRRRRWLTAAAAALAAGVLVTGCSTGPLSGTTPSTGATQPGDGPTSQTSTPTPTPTPDPVTFAATPKNGAAGVTVDTLVKVTASNGTISKVTVSAPVKGRDGKTRTVPVKGGLDDDKTTWTATDRLEPGVKYTVTSTGENDEGTETTTTSTFTTQKLTLADQIYPTISPLSGTYGVAMPIVITFDYPVKDRKTFEKHLSVTSSPKQKGTWSWYSSQEVHYRPQSYWQPGTKITLDADLNGLPAGTGKYAQESRTQEYTIGRSVVTTVNLASKQATVKINGKTARTMPVSGGKSPDFVTRSGTKVISQKLSETRMASETIGIAENSSEGYDLRVKWAMRITNTGEFIHAAPWNSGNMGRVNASHGCVGMNTADAYWLFQNVNIGDPVVVTGTNRGLEKGNGWTDWDVSYKEFASGSAL